MAIKRFIIEVEEGRTHCDCCPIGNAGNCSRFKFSDLGLDCDEFNLTTMKIIKEYEKD